MEPNIPNHSEHSPAAAWARPVSRLSPADTPPGAVNLNIEGRQVTGPLQGFGQLWQKTYRVRLAGCDEEPAEIMDIWKRYFPMFQPADNHFYPSFAGIQPGEILFINTTLPVLPGLPGAIPIASGVMILYADEESFTVMTPEGFPVSGWNTFSVYRDGDEVIAQVQSLERAADPIYEFGFRVMGGAGKQEQTWIHVLRSLATFLDVQNPQITVDRLCLDPNVQWRDAGNVWHNAGIRTTLYVLGTPARAVLHRIRSTGDVAPSAEVEGARNGSAQDATTRDASYWAQPVLRLDASSLTGKTEGVNVTGRRVAGALQGFGQLWQKRYRMRLAGAVATPSDVIAVWKQQFPAFWPKGPRFYAPLAGISPGEVAAIDFFAGTPIHLSTGVMVIYADDESFTYMTPEGHIFAGWITFRAYQDEDGCTVAEAEVLIRPSDPLFDLAFRLGGSKQEDAFWAETLRNLAGHFGVTGTVETTSICLDPRVQWSRIGNVRHNAALRTMLRSIAMPAHWGARQIGARWRATRVRRSIIQ